MLAAVGCVEILFVKSSRLFRLLPGAWTRSHSLDTTLHADGTLACFLSSRPKQAAQVHQPAPALRSSLFCSSLLSNLRTQQVKSGWRTATSSCAVHTLRAPGISKRGGPTASCFVVNFKRRSDSHTLSYGDPPPLLSAWQGSFCISAACCLCTLHRGACTEQHQQASGRSFFCSDDSVEKTQRAAAPFADL